MNDVKKTNNAKSRKSKGRKVPSQRRQTADREEFKDISETKCSNDVRWYAHNPELLRAAASLPFSSTTGTPLPWDSTDDDFATVPGVFAVLWEPSIGGDFNDAINAAKETIYSNVVHANSRNTSYGSTDLILTIIAGMQVFSAIANGVRAWGIMKTYDQRNKYLPESLVQALGFDFQDLQKNLSHMWFDLNELIARCSQIWIPNTFPLMDRWYWLNTNIYMDSESVKGQYYVLTQSCFLQYDETTSNQGTSLQWAKGADGQKYVADKPNTWANYMGMINNMVNALLNSTYRGVMMGDMLKAYGADRIFAMQPVPVDYTVVPVYDREVLTQIENSTLASSDINAILQVMDTHRIETQWPAHSGVEQQAGLYDYAVLNFHQKEVPSPEQIMVATRLTSLGNVVRLMPGSSGKISNVHQATSGTEIVTGYRYWLYKRTGTSYELTKYAYLTYTNSPGQSQMYPQLAFDWAPWVYKVEGGKYQFNTTPAEGFMPTQVKAAFGDYDNYTTIDVETLKKMHNTAIYSEFDVPTIM